MNNKDFQILALDGGGIKGIFSAAILAHLEEDLEINLINHFDLIVGTSTGGIIALGLGIGMRPREILKFYVSEGPGIFKQNMFSKMKQVLNSKYEPFVLEESFKKYFGEKKLIDSKKRLVIPSYNLGDDDVYIFKTPHHKRLKRDFKVPIWKVAMATSAAPTYFPSFNKVDKIRLIDGGVWANNPTLVGITEAVSLLNVKLETIKVLNLGTTDEIPLRPFKLDNGGFWKWRKEAVNVIMSGQSKGSHKIAVHLLGEEKVYRISPKVPDGLFKFDNISVDRIMSKAANESRHFSPIFTKVFLNHKAKIYNPIIN